jgi:H3 lysine-79-specific histone-lysine N-methyltransferase
MNRRDGPGFVRAIERFNDTLNMIRSETMIEHLQSKVNPDSPADLALSRSEWEGLVAVVGEQVYQRVVGPNTNGLKDYVPFSDNVYGELLPK